MAGVILLAIATAGLKIHHKMEDKRSPLLASPPTNEGASPHMTLRTLKRAHKAWLTRELALTCRVRALKAARERGWSACWAGSITMIRPARRARDEAKWVRSRLAAAIAWCNAQEDAEGIKKGSFMLVFKSSSCSERPAFAGTPPSLFELPFPLPIALPADDYTLSVDRSGVTDPPPAYSADLTSGEKMLERTETEVYGAAHANDSSDDSPGPSSPSASSLQSFLVD